MENTTNETNDGVVKTDSCGTDTSVDNATSQNPETVCAKTETPPEKVEKILAEMQQILVVIQKIHKLLDKLPNGPQQKACAEQALQVVDKYRGLGRDLKESLEEVFRYEREENTPINMKYRRYYRQLVEIF